MIRHVSSLTFAEYDFGRYKQLLKDNGYVYMHDIPDGFDHVKFLEQFGPLMPQYDGELIWSIKADPRFDDLYHSLNTKPLMPHTECYEYPAVPPRYLALWCVTPAADEGGATTLADGYAFFEQYSPEVRLALQNRRYDFFSSAGIKDMELGRTGNHPLVECREGRPPIVRFSYNNVRQVGDPLLDDVREGMLRHFDATHVAIHIEKNGLLHWDNHRVLHSRTGFDDRNRHLRRVWLAEPASIPGEVEVGVS
jgi:alpha-ketoglutarate-dependent taurine dioxygenase